MRLLFGNDQPPYTGLKGYIGHTLGAGGAVEAAARFSKALSAGFIPATVGFKDVDPRPCAPRRFSAPIGGKPEAHGELFGFDGLNPSLVFRYGKV